MTAAPTRAGCARVPALARPRHARPCNQPAARPDEVRRGAGGRRVVVRRSAVAALALIGVSLAIALIARDGDEDRPPT